MADLKMNTPSSNSRNVLGTDVEIKGTLSFSDELTLDGKVEGDINSDGALSLGDNATVKGNINVGSVVVRGKIGGNITAKDKVEIKTKTELFGDVRAAKLVIEEGVTLVGKIDVNPNKVSPTPTTVPRASEPTKATPASTKPAGT